MKMHESSWATPVCRFWAHSGSTPPRGQFCAKSARIKLSGMFVQILFSYVVKDINKKVRYSSVDGVKGTKPKKAPLSIWSIAGRESGRQFCVIFHLGPFFGCILGCFFGPSLELEYLGLGWVETYYLFKNPFFGPFWALFNDTELTPSSHIWKQIVKKKDERITQYFPDILQRLAKRYAHFVKYQPGRARQNS